MKRKKIGGIHCWQLKIVFVKLAKLVTHGFAMMADINKEIEQEEKQEFYDKAKKYWSSVDPTLNGVLGGYGWISSVDIRGSHNFLTQIFKVMDFFFLN